MRVNINKKSKNKIQIYGFEIDQGRYEIDSDVRIEMPTNLIANLNSEINIGAFSYGGNNIISNVDIGRYCSVSSDVRIFPKRNHPVDWISSSPFQYNDSFRWWNFFKKNQN
jgi:acetyltransferase-like isoleucine patch superfamily enzyme